MLPNLKATIRQGRHKKQSVNKIDLVKFGDLELWWQKDSFRYGLKQ